MNNLTKYDLAFIGIKLFAIYVGLQIIAGIPTWIMGTAIIFGKSDVTYPIILKFFAIGLPLFSILVPIILWFSANKLAKAITKSKTIVANEKIERTENNDSQAVIFTAVGLFIFVVTIPELTAWLYTWVRILVRSGSTTPLFQQTPSMITFVIISVKIVLSLALMFTAKNLSAFFHKLRYAGSKTLTSKPE